MDAMHDHATNEYEDPLSCQATRTGVGLHPTFGPYSDNYTIKTSSKSEQLYDDCT